MSLTDKAREELDGGFYSLEGLPAHIERIYDHLRRALDVVDAAADYVDGRAVGDYVRVARFEALTLAVAAFEKEVE